MRTDPSAASPVLVFVTWPAHRDAASLARALVGERLAACVNVLPEMRSLYVWQGAIHDEAERQLIVKTTEDRVAALESRVRELHPYDVPEFLVVRVAMGTEAYVGWLRDSTRPV
jgi:periplasmic divalent cation tolerance protein